MQTFDTIKLNVLPQGVKWMNRDAFSQTEREDLQTGIKDTFLKAKAKALPVGVSEISYAEGKDFVLKLSAKTLGQDYLKGISLDNWERCLDAVSPVMKIDAQTVWNNSIMFSCDSTNNIPLADIGAREKQIYLALLSGRSNERFLPIFYNSKNKLGVEFRGTQQEKNRLIAYSKRLDLNKKENDSFMKSLPNPLKMLTDAENIARFEVNHTSFKAMKNRFDVQTNSFAAMMQSNSLVNYDFLKKILKGSGARQSTLFDELENFQGNGISFIQLKGMETIILQFDCNEVAIKHFFKSLFPNENDFKYHWYRKKNNVRSVIDEVRARQQEINQQERNVICERCLDALQKAVA